MAESVTKNEPVTRDVADGPAVIGSKVRAMFGTIAARYDITNTVLSGGVHLFWKWLIIRMVPQGTARALDLCTGTGDLLPLLRERCQQVVGADFCLPMMQNGKRRFAGSGQQFPWVQGDALSLPFPDAAFDLVTVAFGIRNLERLDDGLREISRVLRPGGKILVLEFGQPPNPLFRALYGWYSRVVMPVFGWILTGNRQAYEYLPETAARFPCGEQFAARLRGVGFTPQRTRALTFGIAYIYEADRGSESQR